MKSIKEESFIIETLDRINVSSMRFTPTEEERKGNVLIINSATAVDKRLYFRFSSFMDQNGYDVITYDYRGIAESRPKQLKGFEATGADWGQFFYYCIPTL